MMEDINNFISLRVIISIVTLFIGVSLIIKSLYICFFYIYIIKKWIKTEGKVFEVKTVYFKSKSDADTEGWKLNIKYEFYVDNVKYVSDRISKNIGLLSPKKEIAEYLSNNFIEGQKIDVFYDKNNPKKSIIENKINFNSLSLILVGLIAIYISYVILISSEIFI